MYDMDLRFGLGHFGFILCVAANAVSRAPGEYERKLKTQRNRRGLAQAVDYAVQFDGERKTLPRLEIQTNLFGNRKSLTRTAGQVMHGRRQFVV